MASTKWNGFHYNGWLPIKGIASIEGNGSRKIAPEENCPPALILTLILNQTLTLTGGAILLGDNFPDTEGNVFH